jgi:hypothetical protein
MECCGKMGERRWMGVWIAFGWMGGLGNWCSTERFAVNACRFKGWSGRGSGGGGGIGVRGGTGNGLINCHQQTTIGGTAVLTSLKCAEH